MARERLKLLDLPEEVEAAWPSPRARMRNRVLDAARLPGYRELTCLFVQLQD